MYSTLIEKEKQSSKKRVKRVVANSKKALKKIDCMSKLQENDAKNNEKIKNMKKSNKSLKI